MDPQGFRVRLSSNGFVLSSKRRRLEGKGGIGQVGTENIGQRVTYRDSR